MGEGVTDAATVSERRGAATPDVVTYSAMSTDRVRAKVCIRL